MHLQDAVGRNFIANDFVKLLIAALITCEMNSFGFG